MSAAKKCDICGGLYENYGYNPTNKKNRQPNTIELQCVGDPYDESYVISVKDCCPRCMTTIIKTIDDLEKENFKKNEV